MLIVENENYVYRQNETRLDFSSHLFDDVIYRSSMRLRLRNYWPIHLGLHHSAPINFFSKINAVSTKN